MFWRYVLPPYLGTTLKMEPVCSSETSAALPDLQSARSKSTISMNDKPLESLKSVEVLLKFQKNLFLLQNTHTEPLKCVSIRLSSQPFDVLVVPVSMIRFM
jgi:hypothetical protein